MEDKKGPKQTDISAREIDRTVYVLIDEGEREN